MAAVSVMVAALLLVAGRAHPVAVLADIRALGTVVNLTTPQTPHFPLGLVVALYSAVRFTRPAVAAAAMATALPLVPASTAGPCPSDGPGQHGWPLPF
ncbi:hypothetical protein [Streptomyces sp. NPDC047014]|uniref:hypothetical protein n=1 Tax=Streptomyces sp. NPDC047014 TaxID=3155736 RepID=UPI0033C2CD3B